VHAVGYHCGAARRQRIHPPVGARAGEGAHGGAANSVISQRWSVPAVVERAVEGPTVAPPIGAGLVLVRKRGGEGRRELWLGFRQERADTKFSSAGIKGRPSDPKQGMGREASPGGRRKILAQAKDTA
jgi:hypothetical protein